MNAERQPGGVFRSQESAEKTRGTAESSIVIESRLHLFSVLAEAAEVEHNLMCLYLFAAFSLKRSTEEGVSSEELAAIESWRRAVMGIGLEEMSHLCLVSNLFSALGGTCHFFRPNFPVSPWFYPADFVMELAPFDLATLEHFIFLERPESSPVHDAETFRPKAQYERFSPRNRMMPTSGDYKTVGILYRAIREALTFLAKHLGEKSLFCGDLGQQISPVNISLPGLSEIRDLESALKAIETIVLQGEGATTIKNSHFERFSKIRNEYLRLLEKNPEFKPGRAVARNPVMRKPADPDNQVWITHPVSARFLDLANAIYAFTLRILTQLYVVEGRDPKEKSEFLSMALSLMHVMAALGETLTLLPASEQAPGQFAGITFAMVRTLQPLALKSEIDLLLQAVQRFASILQELRTELAAIKLTLGPAKICETRLEEVQREIEKLIGKLQTLNKAREERVQSPEIALVPAESEPIPKATPKGDVQVSEGKTINVGFNAKKCIHTRHCVTELPQVFKADVPGDWIVPDDASAEILAAVIHECPSGALTYESRGTFPNEPVPPLNVMRVYENGPYAFMADLEIDGKKAGYRATLCRCGLSKNKPYCDHSHVDGHFEATGEPPTINDKALKQRAGPLEIKRTPDGPLAVSGNLEICAASGRTVLKATSVNMCRCGHSKTKPVCDGSHLAANFKDPISDSSKP